MSSTLPTVLVVEDDEEVRARICSGIKREPGLCLQADVGTFHAARTLLGKQLPRLALIDLDLPDGSGCELIQWLSVQRENIDCLVLTVFGDERNVVNAIEAGAAGYLLKSEDLHEVGPMLLRLLEGESPISPAVARYILNLARRNQTNHQTKPETIDSQEQHERLTPTELEILRYIAKGYSAPEIARMTNRSPNTVPVHVKNIYRKLSVHNRVEAVYEAMQLGLIATVSN